MKKIRNHASNYLGIFIIKRFIFLIPITLGVTFLIYALMFFTSSDPVEIMLIAQGIPISSEVIDSMRQKIGLDQPFFIQYTSWLFRFVTGDMGKSFVDGRSVATIVFKALPQTLLLTTVSMGMTIVISIPLGILSAVRQNKISDKIIRMFSFLSNAMPNYILSFILIYIFALKLNLISVLATNSFAGLILPMIALVFPMTGKYIRHVRGAILEQLGQDYVRGLLSKGIRIEKIVFKDVFMNAFGTILTHFSLSLGSLLGGTVIVERIFQWQGMGYIAIEAILQRDYPVIQAYVVWMTIIYILINLSVDILLVATNPRMRAEIKMSHIKRREKV